MYPNLAEANYWYGGYIVYTVGGFAFLWFLYQWLEYIKGGQNFFVLGFAYFIAITFSEFHMVMIIGIIGLSMLYFWVEKRKLPNHFALIMLLFGAILIVLLIAPGNFKRLGEYSTSRDYATIFYMSFTNSLRFLFRWLFNFPIAISSLLVLLYLKEIKELVKLPKIPLWVLGGCLVLLLFSAVFVPTFITGIIGQLRTPNAATTLFFLLFFFLIYQYGELVPRFFIRILRLVTPLRNWLALSFIVSLCLTNNTHQLLLEIENGTLKKVYQQLLNRQAAIRDSPFRHLDDVKTLEKWSIVINYDIRPGKDFYVNQAEQTYYKRVGLFSDQN